MSPDEVEQQKRVLQAGLECSQAFAAAWDKLAALHKLGAADMVDRVYAVLCKQVDEYRAIKEGN